MGNNYLVGVFQKEIDAMNAVIGLKKIGYVDAEITVIAKEKKAVKFIDEVTDANVRTRRSPGITPESIFAGGIVVGTGVLLASLGMAAPQSTSLLAAEPMLSTLGGLLAGGVFGGLISNLMDMGVKEKDAQEYKEYIDQGHILLLVENKAAYEDQVYQNYSENHSVIQDRYPIALLV